MITDEIKKEIKKVIIGKDDVISKVLLAILARGHVLLEDVPGVGKTSLALAFSKALGLDCKRIQFTADTMPSDVVGFSVFEKNSSRFVYKPGAVMTNLLLADEINRTSSKTQSALLEAMEEGKVTVDGVTHDLPVPFTTLATENPIGSAGTQLLPVSQLDRFMLKLSMGYPDRASQVEIMRDRHHANPIDAVKPVCTAADLSKLIEDVQSIFVSDAVYEYIAELTERTRVHPMIKFGVSPRGALAVCRAAKAHACLEQRDYVNADDVVYVFSDVCSHRIVLGSKARIRDCTEQSVIAEIILGCKKPGIREFSRR